MNRVCFDFNTVPADPRQTKSKNIINTVIVFNTIISYSLFYIFLIHCYALCYFILSKLGGQLNPRTLRGFKKAIENDFWPLLECKCSFSSPTQHVIDRKFRKALNHITPSDSQR